MLRIQRDCFDNCAGYSSVLVALLLVAGMLANGCVAPRVTPKQTTSPMIPAHNATLINNRWRIDEVTDQGNSVVFKEIGLIYIAFLSVGTLNIFADCPGGAYWMIAEDTNRYQLIGGEFSAVDCGEPINTQFAQVKNALEDTTRFEIEGQRLFLLGEESKLVLEVDNPP